MPLPDHITAHLRNLAGHQQYDHGIGADEIATNTRVNPTTGQREQIIANIKPGYEGRFSSEGWMVAGQPRQSVDNMTNRMAQMLNSPDAVGFVEPRSGNQKYDKMHFCLTDPETGKKYWLVINPNDPANGGSIRRMRDPDPSFNRLMETSAAATQAAGGNVYERGPDGKLKPIAGGYSAVAQRYNAGSKTPLAENQSVTPSDKLRRAENGEVRVATPEERAAHANGTARPNPAATPDAPERPHAPATPHAPNVGRVAGIVGVVIAAAAAAGEAAAAEGRTPGLADYGRAAWNNTAGGAMSENRKIEAVMRVLEGADVTQGLLSSAVRTGLRSAGLDADPGLLENLDRLNPEQRRRFQHDANLLAINARDQWAILQESGLADIRDPKGERVDVGAILRDPTQRQAFIDSLKKSYETTQDPAEKEKLRVMISGANRYGELQEYRQTVVADARATIQNPNGKPGAPLPASPMAPLAATGFKSFGGDVASVTASSRGNIHGAIINDLERVEVINIDTSRTAELLDPSTFLMRARSDTPGTETQPSENEKPKPVIKQAPVLDSTNF